MRAESPAEAEPLTHVAGPSHLLQHVCHPLDLCASARRRPYPAPVDRTADDVHRILRAHLPDQPATTVTLLGEGVDNVAFEIDGALVVRFRKDPDPVLVRHEAAVLAVAGRVPPVPVPKPMLVVPELGCLACPRLPGVRCRCCAAPSHQDPSPACWPSCSPRCTRCRSASSRASRRQRSTQTGTPSP